MKTKILSLLFGVLFSTYAINSNAQPFTGAGAGSVIGALNYGSTSHGDYSMHFTTTGSYNTAMGQYSLYKNVAGFYNTATGSYSLYNNTGSNNTANGYQSLYKNTTGEYNTAVGNSSLYSNTIGLNNTAMGRRSLYKNTTGKENSALGSSTLYNNQTGSYNTAGGYNSLYANTGDGNTAYGHSSLYFNYDGTYNTGIGNNSLLNNQSGKYNTALGVQSMSINQTGTDNTAIGAYALNGNINGSHNTAIGDGADVGAGGLTNATAVGNGTVVMQNNTMKFGNQAVWGWGFGNDPNFANNEALVVGVFGTLTHGNGAFCTQNGVWTNTSSKEFKEDFTKQDLKIVLNKINALSVTKWRYKGSNEYHIGPVAEDFYEAFNIGTNNKTISTIDPSGVALLGIQALSKKQDELSAENVELKSEIAELKKMLSALQEKKPGNIIWPANAEQSDKISTSLTNATLEQNIPNPLKGNTSLRYRLPEVFKSAQIVITNFSGKTIKQLTLKTPGLGSLNIDASLLSNGVYNYSLIIDGKIIDSKKMVVAK